MDERVEQTIRRLSRELVAAWESTDVERVERYFTREPSALFFDAAPLKYNGWPDYKSASRENFAHRFGRQRFVVHDDMVVLHSQDLAVSAFTLHLAVEVRHGDPVDADGRCTFVWERRGDDWLIVHEHLSLPAVLPPAGES